MLCDPHRLRLASFKGFPFVDAVGTLDDTAFSNFFTGGGMRRVISYVLAVGLAIQAGWVQAGCGVQIQSSPVEAARIAEQERQVKLQRELDLELAPVRSASTLASWISSGRAQALERLAPGSRQQFLDSLRFGANGLASFRYDLLESELTLSEAHELLAAFGAQHAVRFLKHARSVSRADALLNARNNDLRAMCWGDHKDYQCIGRATCESSGGRICMSGC